MGVQGAGGTHKCGSLLFFGEQVDDVQARWLFCLCEQVRQTQTSGLKVLTRALFSERTAKTKSNRNKNFTEKIVLKLEEREKNNKNNEP